MNSNAGLPELRLLTFSKSGGKHQASRTSSHQRNETGAGWPRLHHPDLAQTRSNRSAFMTLFQAATKSFANFSFESEQA